MARLLVPELALLTLLVTAGCLGAPLTDGPVENPESSTTTTHETTVQQATYPDPPAELTNDSAIEAAVAYEAARLQNELRNESDVTYFELAYLSSVNTTVLNRSDGGVYLKLSATYSYATETKSADGVPVVSIYFVSESEIRFVRELDDEA